MISTLRTALVLVVLGLGLGPGGPASAQTTPVKFSMDWAWQGSQAIWPLAQDQGCFAREKLEVTIDRGYGAGDVIAKVASGVYDIGFADFNTLVAFNARNPGKRVLGVFMVYDATPTSITVLRSSGITRPGDLAGKRLASPVNDASRQLFPIFAQINGLDPSRVTWITTTPELRETMLARQQADGTAGHMWTSLIGLQALGVKADDITTLLYSRWGLDLFGSALITRPAWAAERPTAVTSFIRCVVQGINGALADPRAAMTALKKRDPLIDERVESERLRLSLAVAVLTDNAKKNGMNSIDGDRLRRSISLVSRIFEVPEPKVEDIWTDQYLPARSELTLRP